jgi:hypothetical protein
LTATGEVSGAAGAAGAVAGLTTITTDGSTITAVVTGGSTITVSQESGHDGQRADLRRTLPLFHPSLLPLEALLLPDLSPSRTALAVSSPALLALDRPSP